MVRLQRRSSQALIYTALLAYLWVFGAPMPIWWSMRLGPMAGMQRASAAESSRELDAGLNLFALPSAVPVGAESCFALLGFLGGAEVVERISRVDAATQQIEECFFDADTPTGVDFPLAVGEGYFLRMIQASTVMLDTPLSCPDAVLEPGVNLVGVPGPADGLGCFGLLATIGSAAVATVERLNPETAAFEACVFDNTSSPTGVDFSIEPGTGYLVHMQRGVPLMNLNDTANPNRCLVLEPLVCERLDPSRGPLGSQVTVRGRGFVDGEMLVSFHGTAATISATSCDT